MELYSNICIDCMDTGIIEIHEGNQFKDSIYKEYCICEQGQYLENLEEYELQLYMNRTQKYDEDSYWYEQYEIYLQEQTIELFHELPFNISNKKRKYDDYYSDI